MGLFKKIGRWVGNTVKKFLGMDYSWKADDIKVGLGPPTQSQIANYNANSTALAPNMTQKTFNPLAQKQYEISELIKMKEQASVSDKLRDKGLHSIVSSPHGLPFGIASDIDMRMLANAELAEKEEAEKAMQAKKADTGINEGEGNFTVSPLVYLSVGLVLILILKK